MELLFWILIMFIWIIFSQTQKKKRHPRPETKVEPDDELTYSIEEEIWQTLGFPRIPKPKVQKKKEEKPVTIQTDKEKIKPKEKEEKPKLEIPMAVLSLETKIKPPELLTLDKLKEGIIFSIILGPPKAFSSGRGGGIGMRAGLKNR